MAAVFAVVGATASVGPAGAQGSSTASGPTSIVQLGDSVAAGEGTLYGYTYDPSTRTWTGGNLDATWPGPHPLCHDSPDAYGEHVAQAFGATFTQLACTGATFGNGIARPEVQDGQTYSPAQFGNWAKQTDINEAYDAAQPDLVLITLGADDVRFVDIVESCVESRLGSDLDLDDIECVARNPGDTIRTDYLDVYDSVLPANYKRLVRWIGERAEARGVETPKIVFTTYPDPLPAPDQRCPDVRYLAPRQVRYLSSLVDRLNTVITDTVDSLDDPNVVVADASDVYTADGDHTWCSSDPWAYGLSIIDVLRPSSIESQAPFHPTPVGQDAIADVVTSTVRQLYSD